MDNPAGGLPQLPPNLREKLDQLKRLTDELRLDLAGVTAEPVDDTRLPSLKKPINQDNVADIIDALNDLKDPYVRRSGLKIDGVEMTQSVQFYDLHGQGSGADSDNTVPLVAGKDLILRAYVERRAGSFFAPPERFDGVVGYRGKQLSSLNGPRRLQEPAALGRRFIDDSLNFRIPAADCHGTVNFTVRAYEWRPDSRFVVPGRFDNYHSAAYRITAVFREVPRMKLTGVLIRFTGSNQNLAAPTGVDLVTTAARFLPMLPTPGFDYNACTVIDYGEDLTVRKNWDKLLNIIANLRSASTTRTYYVGLLPAGVASLAGAPARGIGRAGAAVASKDDTRALGHEFGHACQLDHVNVNGPEPPHDPKYPDYGPFPFGSVGEAGLDAARMTLYDPPSSFDFMTYNENGPTTLFPTSTWISPYHYKKMMNAIRTTEGTGDFPPLIVSFTATVMLFNFRVHRGGRVEVAPSYPVTGLPAIRDGRPPADIMLDLYDRNGELIDSHRCHRHNPYQDPDGAYLDFHEALPWPEDVGEVVVVRGRRRLGRLRVGGERGREVRVEGVRRLEQEGQGDLARIDWSVSGDDPQEGGADETAALVRYSHDGGRTWQAVAADLREARCLVNLDLLPGGDDCRFQLVVSSGLSAAVAESEPFAVRLKPRRAHIVSPRDGQTFRAGDPVVFAGAGHSPDYGTSADDEVAWSSSLECCGLGTGSHLVRDDLPPGTHRVTLATGDGRGGETTASVWIKVEAAPDRDKC
ncbi:MAG TPA: hypothetical protein VIP46_20740 [Pyrinomonadaceae bacterium]